MSDHTDDIETTVGICGVDENYDLIKRLRHLINLGNKIIGEQAEELERLRAVLQRIADMPVDGYESTIPVRSIARVALEDDNESDDTDGTGVNTDWLRDDAGR